MACKFQQTLLLLALMLSIAAVALGQLPDPCGENKEFKSCGTACPSKCGDEPRACIQVCVAGCFCKSDYVLNAAGKCVRPQDC